MAQDQLPGRGRERAPQGGEPAGLSLLLGYKARLGALLLFLFLIPVTLTFHNWWTYADPKDQHTNMLFFLHNLALMGGLLLVMTWGPGPLSIDNRGRRPS